MDPGAPSRHAHREREEKPPVLPTGITAVVLAVNRRSCLNGGTERELETLLQLPSYSCSSPSPSSSYTTRTTSLSHHIQSLWRCEE
ncbi:hypothetical protein NQZ68_016577 [Dissostichus eleginoides]|nr:hypothetical protein NQZ68_016577 [Dissostichus eleginoides]